VASGWHPSAWTTGKGIRDRRADPVCRPAQRITAANQPRSEASPHNAQIGPQRSAGATPIPGGTDGRISNERLRTVSGDLACQPLAVSTPEHTLTHLGTLQRLVLGFCGSLAEARCRACPSDTTHPANRATLPWEEASLFAEVYERIKRHDTWTRLTITR